MCQSKELRHTHTCRHSEGGKTTEAYLCVNRELSCAECAMLIRMLVRTGLLKQANQDRLISIWDCRISVPSQQV